MSTSLVNATVRVAEAVAIALNTPEVEVKLTFSTDAEGTFFKRLVFEELLKLEQLDHAASLREMMLGTANHNSFELLNGSAITFLLEE